MVGALSTSMQIESGLAEVEDKFILLIKGCSFTLQHPVMHQRDL